MKSIVFCLVLILFHSNVSYTKDTETKIDFTFEQGEYHVGNGIGFVASNQTSTKNSQEIRQFRYEKLNPAQLLLELTDKGLIGTECLESTRSFKKKLLDMNLSSNIDVHLKIRSQYDPAAPKSQNTSFLILEIKDRKSQKLFSGYDSVSDKYRPDCSVDIENLFKSTYNKFLKSRETTNSNLPIFEELMSSSSYHKSSK